MTDPAPLALPLGPRTIIRFTGPDSLRYLNGQVTRDIRPLAAGTSSALACVTDAKGRLCALVRIIAADPQTWFVEAPPQADSSLYDRLTRYLIADDAEATEVSGDWHIIHRAGATPAALPDAAMIRASDRFGADGHDIWLPAAQHTAMGAPSDLSCRDFFETRRIEAGIPEWGSDATEGMLPAELGLDRTAVSFTKGCYIGQEVISRMKYAGKVNRRLTRVSLSPYLLPPDLHGAVLAARESEGGEPAGLLTSIAPLVSQDERRAALAVLSRPWLDSTDFDVIAGDGTRHASAARALGPA